VINAIGKRGSNDWHGSLVTYLQTNALNANSSDRTAPQPGHLHQHHHAPRRHAGIFLNQKDYNTIVRPARRAGNPEEQALDLLQLHSERQYHSPYHQFHRPNPETGL
jgi:hypothetical protein